MTKAPLGETQKISFSFYIVSGLGNLGIGMRLWRATVDSLTPGQRMGPEEKEKNMNSLSSHLPRASIATILSYKRR